MLTMIEFFKLHPVPWSVKDGYVLDSNGKDVGMELSAQFVVALINTHDWHVEHKEV